MNSDTKPKHTPGPWNIHRNFECKKGGRRWIEAKNGSEIIAHVYHIGKPGIIADANARLIAAAPELLEALKMLHDENKDYMKINHLGDPYHNQSMRMALAAIAKATGGQGE